MTSPATLVPPAERDRTGRPDEPVDTTVACAELIYEEVDGVALLTDPIPVLAALLARFDTPTLRQEHFDAATALSERMRSRLRTTPIIRGSLYCAVLVAVAPEDAQMCEILAGLAADHRGDLDGGQLIAAARALNAGR